MLNKTQAAGAVRNLLAQYGYEANRFDKIDKAMKPWSYEDAARRFGLDPRAKSSQRQVDIALDSQALFLPLVLDTFAQSMKVDNFVTSKREKSPAWEHWQRNSMDAIQTGITRAALQYGTSYAVVDKGELFGNPAPIISGVSPRNMVAYYGERYAWPGENGKSTEWPILALEIKDNRLRLFDEEHVYYFGAKEIPKYPSGWLDTPYNVGANLDFIEARPHGAGVVPVVRFRDRWMLGSQPQVGIIEPLISLQNRIDRTAYEMGVAQYYAAFKQRYIIGWMPKEEEASARMKASSTWFINENASNVKIGQFDETDLTRYVESRAASARDLAAIAQVPPQALGLSAVSNISADGLASMEAAKDRKASELQTSLGESYEQLLRLCAYMVGDMDTANDYGAEIIWRDMSARSFAQTVDGLGKISQMLGVPGAMLLEDVPGFTAEKIERIQGYLADNPPKDDYAKMGDDDNTTGA